MEGETGRKGTKMNVESMHYAFADAEQALVWSAEVLRRRRLPKLSRIWDEVREEAEFVAKVWGGGSAMRGDFCLPGNEGDRLTLALKVEGLMEALFRRGEEDMALLRLWVWGDWADEARLQRALQMQEVLRRRGMRVKLSYRYSFGQLGRLLGVDRKVAWRRVRAAMEVLEREMVGAGLVAGMMPVAEGAGLWGEDDRVIG